MILPQEESLYTSDDKVIDIDSMELEEKIEFLEQYTRHLEKKIDDNFDMIRNLAIALDIVVDRLLGN